ncbi:MAG: hypothetical protein DRI36_00065 [Caldiserica bacterium]|nr:MAG: hypothetical protein DRI36_00065 [Caldisericota bacterium]
MFAILFLLLLSSESFLVKNRGVYLGGKTFIVRGICYSPTPVGEDVSLGYEWWNDDYYLDDLPLLKSLGCNVIRTYDMKATSSDEEVRLEKVLDDFYNYGIYIIMGYWVNPGQDFSSPTIRDSLKNDFINMVEKWKNHPAVFGWCFGNEVWPGGSGTDEEKWKSWYSLVEEVSSLTKSIDPDHPVMTVNSDIWTIGRTELGSDDSSLPSLDIWGVNLYLGDSFQSRFSSFTVLSSKPFLITEFGCDAWNGKVGSEDEDLQANYIQAQWKEIEENLFTESGAVIGGCLFEWVDEWWKSNSGSPSSHDTSSDWTNVYYSDPSMNEEWWGIRKILLPPYNCSSREAYFTLQNLWSKYVLSSEKVYVFPNPFYPGRGQKLSFGNLPVNSEKIRIFAISGEFIDEISVINQQANWYGENYYGKPAASGVYFFVVYPAGQKGKFVLIK